MISVTIAQRKYVNQDKFENSKEGENILTEKAFNSFIENLIREYSIHKNDGYQLFVNDLPHAEKKQFLSYLSPVDDYEYYIENKTREIEAIKEFEDEMQYFIDQRKDDLYHEDMAEMGYYLSQHKDNGEFYYKDK